ncbi:dihydroxyacetone kinase subunit DhaL [Actinotalea sp. K2]|uniref:dihydroxyacetone kinase subunit DhaL n=1 Tax=Actinotalea sp. K2 TaxID=2939438 RepID=UPI002016EF88|nr:dihydroxyacetone kinase subunit DhaL [Actinotalea sp. K2]MCL3860260.1 dihydroxyacetone kinase subunit DhaL [Actinotalea sp. K2]
MALDVAWAVRWVRLTAGLVTEHRAYLTELDRQIGDNDHGENLYRGYTAVVARLDALEGPPAQVGDVLKLVATTLMSTVGGAAGPLYGTAYLRAAKVTGLDELDAGAVVAMLEAGLEGIVARGKAVPGEKTMVDAWSPAVAAAQAACVEGVDPVVVLEAAATAAEEGAVATDPMVATKGRASYLGERSAGHRDPGAASSALLVRAAHTAAVDGA